MIFLAGVSEPGQMSRTEAPVPLVAARVQIPSPALPFNSQFDGEDYDKRN